MKTLSPPEALHRAAALCSKSEYCSTEIDEKLSAWGVAPPEREIIIERLTAEKFIDDQRFARLFAHDKLRFNRWGKVKISYALQQKRIPASYIREALEQIDATLYEQTLASLITAKARTLTDEDEYQRRNKIYRFALGHGFEPEVINRILPLNTP